MRAWDDVGVSADLPYSGICKKSRRMWVSMLYTEDIEVPTVWFIFKNHDIVFLSDPVDLLSPLNGHRRSGRILTSSKISVSQFSAKFSANVRYYIHNFWFRSF